MKMKIFHSADWGIMEQTVNEWLNKERISRLLCVTHTNYEAMIFITVWWSQTRVESPNGEPTAASHPAIKSDSSAILSRGWCDLSQSISVTIADQGSFRRMRSTVSLISLTSLSMY